MLDIYPPPFSIFAANKSIFITVFQRVVMQVDEAISSQVSNRYVPAKKKLLAFGGLGVAISLPVALLLLLRTEIIQMPLSVGQAVESVQFPSLHERAPITIGGASAAKQAVLFFTVECPHCQRELLNFEELFRRYQKLINFVAVSLSDPTKTQNFMRDRAFSFPVVIDENRKGKERFRVMSVPALYLIDEHGILRQRRFGETSQQADEQLILTFLNETTRSSSQ